TFPDNPTAWGLPSIHNAEWDALWKVCADYDVMICCHIGSGPGAPHASEETPIDAWIVSMPISIANSAADWLHSEVWRKYPNLKMTLSEGGIGWIPYFTERADITFERHREWTFSDFGGKLPSEVFREHMVTCFIDEAYGVRNIEAIGEDMVCWECDYPHADTTWPEAPEYLWRSIANMPDRVINKITHENAMRLYHFDPFAHRAKAASTVGALRALATDVDTTPLESVGGAKPVSSGHRITSGDVNRMMQVMAEQK
ncbi:MAG: amidohydrolase, partial [Alphaproteobacteria bacterium]|nr:amidohydrolase [Alphaproteobacteria bacterium]